VVAERLNRVRTRVAVAADRAGRDPATVLLVAVSKGRPVESILQAYAAGQRHFGESRAQELTAKAPELPADIAWHFVGPLQRNKVSRVRPVTTLLHSLDRIRLAAAWARPGPGPVAPARVPPALLEINVAHEPQKHGFSPAEAGAAAEEAIGLGVDLRGLMTVAPLASDPAEVRPVFAELAEIRTTLAARWPRLTELSMGMTDDFEVAIEEGATIVRVGRAIFGVVPTATGTGG